MIQPICEVSEGDYVRGTQYAAALQARSNRNGYNAASIRRRDPAERMRDDANGHCGQLAFCRHLGIEWVPDPNAFGSKPIAGTFEIRTTVREGGRLIVRDYPERCHVLITGNACEQPRELTIRGYIWGRDAMCEEFLEAPGGGKPAWFVPQGALSELDESVRLRMLAYCSSRIGA